MTIPDETTRIEAVQIKRIEKDKYQEKLMSIIITGVTKIDNPGLQNNPKTQVLA